MSFLLPRVYPLTDVRLTGLSHSEQVKRLSAGGAALVQLREKGMAVRDFFAEAQAALINARDSGVKLIINDRVDLAMAIGADGVHLGQDDLPPVSARALLGPQAIIGFSTHDRLQAISALALPIDYIAVGPVFPTQTKGDTAPHLGLAGVREVRQAIGSFPLVAIGGITEVNALDVVAAGADSVALISSLLAEPVEITTRTARLLQTLKDF
jgi:thiamine-phosphate pyrophosphorylase